MFVVQIKAVLLVEKVQDFGSHFTYKQHGAEYKCSQQPTWQQQAEAEAELATEEQGWPTCNGHVVRQDGFSIEQSYLRLGQAALGCHSCLKIGMSIS
jgi:hypothetical protein